MFKASTQDHLFDNASAHVQQPPRLHERREEKALQYLKSRVRGTSRIAADFLGYPTIEIDHQALQMIFISEAFYLQYNDSECPKSGRVLSNERGCTYICLY